MSVVSDIRRAMRPAQLEPWETKALFQAITLLLRRSPRTSHLQPVAVPAVTVGGRAYVLTLHLRGGAIARFEVDHDPDMESTEMVAYLEKRGEWEREKRLGEAAPDA